MEEEGWRCRTVEGDWSLEMEGAGGGWKRREGNLDIEINLVVELRKGLSLNNPCAREWDSNQP